MAKSKKHLIVVAAVVVLALGAGVMFMGADHEAAETVETVTDSRVVVETQTPERGEIVVTGEFIGKVEPGQQVTVYPKVSGEVLQVLASVGDTVSAGDVLFQVDSKTLATTIAQSQASVSAAQAKTRLSLEMAEKDRETTTYNIEEGYDTGLIAAEAAVKTAENGVRTASATVTAARRALREFRDNEDTYSFAAGANDFDAQMDKLHDAVIQAEIGHERAILALEQAQENLAAAQNATGTTTEKMEDAVRMAELNTDMSDQLIAIQKLQDDLANYTVRSPISGVIEQKNIDEFDMASPQAPAFVISNKEALSITFNVSETAVLGLRVGDGIVVEKNGVTSNGTITEISTMVDARSGLFAVKATVQNPAFDMLSGSSVKVYIDTEKVEDSLTVPIDALYYESGTPYVYVAENGAVKKVYVETGISDDMRIEIISGISEKTEIITTWNPNLAEGVEISVYGQESDGVSSEEEEAA